MSYRHWNQPGASEVYCTADCVRVWCLRSPQLCSVFKSGYRVAEICNCCL